MNKSERERVIKAVGQAIESFNQQLPADRRIVPTPECKLVGSPNLDSADVVSLLVMVEQQVEQELDVAISVFDGHTVGQGIESFVTVDALVEFLAERIPRGRAQQ